MRVDGEHGIRNLLGQELADAYEAGGLAQAGETYFFDGTAVSRGDQRGEGGLAEAALASAHADAGRRLEGEGAAGRSERDRAQCCRRHFLAAADEGVRCDQLEIVRGRVKEGFKAQAESLHPCQAAAQTGLTRFAAAGASDPPSGGKTGEGAFEQSELDPADGGAVTRGKDIDAARLEIVIALRQPTAALAQVGEPAAQDEFSGTLAARGVVVSCPARGERAVM